MAESSPYYDAPPSSSAASPMDPSQPPPLAPQVAEPTDDEIEAQLEQARVLAVATEKLDEYHARAPMFDQRIAEAVKRISEDARMVMRASGILARARLNQNLFYGRDGNAVWEENLRPGGENGDSLEVSVNVTRNLVRHIVGMVNSVRPVVDPRAGTTDSKAVDIVEIGRALSDLYLHKLKHVRYADKGAEHAPVHGVAFIHRYWDEYSGGLFSPDGAFPKDHPVLLDTLPDGQTITKAFRGDVKHENPTLLDVWFDYGARSWDEIDEVVVRVFRNRYDLIARHPEHAVSIANASTMGSLTTAGLDEMLPSPTSLSKGLAQSDARRTKIEVWYYYHRKTLGCPIGRQTLLLPDGTILDDRELQWDDIPLFRMAPEEMLGSVHGYSTVTSLGGMQEALNIGVSAIVTNIAAFGRNIIVADRAAEIDPTNLTGDLKLLEADFDNGKPPLQVLELMKIPPELMNAMQMLLGWMEQDAGVNAIVRGDPKGVTAGVAINLFQAMALQFASPLEKARAEAIEWMVNGIVEALRRHPDVQRDLPAVGKKKRQQLFKFYGRELEDIRCFDVELGNPMSRTVAGRLQMLQALRQDGLPIPPEKAMQILNTGNLDTSTEAVVIEQNLILAENEALLEGKDVPVRPGDDHLLHLQEHRSVAANPDVRFDAEKLAALDRHEQQHVKLWMDGDIVLKIARGGLPMGPMMMPPAAPPGAPPGQGGAAAAPHGPPPHGPPPKKGPDLGALPALQPPPMPPMPRVPPQ